MAWMGNLYYRMARTCFGHGCLRRALRVMRGLGLQRSFSTPLDALNLPHRESAALMDLWTRMHWSSGDGMMPPRELLAVFELAASWPGRGDVVELGAWTGLTTCYLAAACRLRKEGQVYAVDTYAGTREHDSTYTSMEHFEGSTLPAFEARMAQAAMQSRVTPLVGFTSEVVHAYPGGPIRFLLIDADHSYAGVKADFELWSPLVEPGGLVVFHDYAMPEVARFVDELVSAGEAVYDAPGEVLPNVYAVTNAIRRAEGPRAEAASSRQAQLQTFVPV